MGPLVGAEGLRAAPREWEGLVPFTEAAPGRCLTPPAT